MSTAHGGTGEFAKRYGMANVEWGIPDSVHTRFHAAPGSTTFTAAVIVLSDSHSRVSQGIAVDLVAMVFDQPTATKPSMAAPLSRAMLEVAGGAVCDYGAAALVRLGLTHGSRGSDPAMAIAPSATS